MGGLRGRHGAVAGPDGWKYKWVGFSGRESGRPRQILGD